MKSEQVFEKHCGHPVNYIQCQSSAAHTFGNVTAYIQNWLIKLFPDGLFKTLHVNSKIAHAQLRSTPNEFLKKQTPMFIIRPRVEWNDSTRFLNGTMLIERQGDLYHSYGGTNLQPFIHDNKNRLSLKYQLNRHVLNFDVILIFSTLIQQLNWSNYFLNAVRQNIPFNLETCLESYLSPELLKYISFCSGIPMIDNEGSSKHFLRYLNSNSIYPITYKIQGSSGTEEYYRYYPALIDTIITNFNTDEGEKSGHVMTRYQISFSVRCEFYSTGFYYLFSDKLNKQTIITVNDDNKQIVPIFTDVITQDDVDLPLGWKLYASPSCGLDHSNDSINIESLFNDSIKQAIKFHLERGIPISEFFKIRVRKQGALLQDGVHYKFDPSTYTLSFYNCSTYYTYKILIMLNIEYINNLIKDVYKLK